MTPKKEPTAVKKEFPPQGSDAQTPFSRVPFNAEAEGITVDHIIDRVLQAVPQQPAGAAL